MNTIIYTIKLLIRFPFILLFIIFPSLFDISLPVPSFTSTVEGSGLFASSKSFTYLCYNLSNKNIEEEFTNKYFLSKYTPKQISFERQLSHKSIYNVMPYTILNYGCSTLIIILVGFILGISRLSISLGGHAPPLRVQ